MRKTFKNITIYLLGMAMMCQPILAKTGTSELQLNKNLKVDIRGIEVNFTDSTGYPATYKGRTYIPIGMLAPKFSLVPKYDAASRTVELKGMTTDLNIVFTLGSHIAKVNGAQIPLDKRNGTIETATTVTTFNGRTYVPVRFVAEQLGFNVTINNNQISFNYPTATEVLKGLEEVTLGDVVSDYDIKRCALGRISSNSRDVKLTYLKDADAEYVTIADGLDVYKPVREGNALVFKTSKKARISIAMLYDKLTLLHSSSADTTTNNSAVFDFSNSLEYEDSFYKNCKYFLIFIDSKSAKDDGINNSEHVVMVDRSFLSNLAK